MMGLLSWIVGLPVAPVRGVVALGRVIHRQVEQEIHDPASVRRRLEEAEEARAEGEMSEVEEAEIQREAVRSVIEPSTPEAADVPSSQDEDESHT
jgi:hypothetical protein